MSKQRQRNRAAREAARAQERATAARPKPAPAADRGRRRPAREPVYRLRRFPRLPWRLKAALALGWLAAAVAIVYLVPSWSARLGLLVVATAAVPLLVVIVRDPSRRPR